MTPSADLVVEDLIEGDGREAKAGDTVSAHYVGVAHSTGEEFDSSWNRGAPLDFRLGVGMVIPGVKTRTFNLHYQPIVDLKTGAVHHFEALSRFSGDISPINTIRMAKELALIEGFDLAVAEKALQRLRKPGSGLLKIAVNVSGSRQ